MSIQAFQQITKTERENCVRTNTTLEKLVEKSADGDAGAICDLCAILAKSVLYRASLLLGDHTDAQNVSQDVLLRVCENIRDFGDAESFRTWLSGAVISETRRFAAEHSKHGAVLNVSDYLGASAEDGDGQLAQDYSEYENVRRAVLKIVSHLPLQLREAIILHYFDGLRIAEVAAAMGIPYHNATRYLEIALKRLKHEIGKQPASTRLGVLGFFPMGSVLAESFRAGSEIFTPACSEWERGAVETCRQFMLVNNESI